NRGSRRSFGTGGERCDFDDSDRLRKRRRPGREQARRQSRPAGRRGNLTGFSYLTVELMAKRLDLLSELVPQAGVVALLANPTRSSAGRMIRDVEEAARAKGVQLHILKVSAENEIDAAFAGLVQLHAGALLIGGDPFF